jgi:integrase
MRERAPGVWELRVYVGRDPITAKHSVVSRTFRGGKRGAATALAKLVGELDEPGRRRVAPSKLTVTQLITDRLAEWDGSPTTKAHYQSQLNKHIAPTVGRLTITELDARMLDRFYRWLRDEQHLSASTIRSIHSLIRGSLRRAVVFGYLKSNPAIEVHPPVPRRKEIDLPDAGAVADAIVRLARDDPPYGCLVRLAAATGARNGELCALQWADVDFEHGTVRVDATIVATAETGVIRKPTKTHTFRTIALDSATVEALRAHREAMVERASACGVEVGETGYVFSHSPAGSVPWRPDHVTNKWAHHREKLGLKGVRLHDLRHLQATMLLKAGVPVRNVSKRLGHRDPSVTLNVYAQYLEDSDHDAAAIMGKLLVARELDNQPQSS